MEARDARLAAPQGAVAPGALRRLIVAAIAVATLVSLAASGGPSIASAASPPEAAGAKRAAPIHKTKLTRAIRKDVHKANIPGVIVGVWRPGRAPYTRAFGVRNTNTGLRMKTNLNTRIGSVTKSFVVTGVLQLVDRGLVGLDDPISEYVPGVPSGDVITIRQLAAMRSGLYSYTNPPFIPNGVASQPHRQWKVPELLDMSFSHPLVFEPGTEFDYSNTNTVLLGRVIERVTGERLAAYLDENIIDPLGLEHTLLPHGARFPSPHAHGYTDWAAGKYSDATNWNPSWGWAAGGMISRLGDLHKWARVVATGKLLKPATQRARTDFLPAPGEGGATYGLGLMNYNGWISHDGNIAGYISFPFYLPASRTTMVVLFNSNYFVLDRVALMRTITKIITPGHVWPDPSKYP
jgi:D-alanyl-D-alanine carboxypeptidase